MSTHQRRKIPSRRRPTRAAPRVPNLPPEVLDSFHALGPVMLLNPDGTVQAMNRAALDLLGYAADEVLGQPIGRFFAERKKERKKALARMAREAPRYAVEATLIARTGERIPVALFGALVLDARERKLGVVHVVHPMSPTPPLSTEAQARLNQLLDIAPDAIIVLDEDQRVLTFNRGAERIFGYRAEEVLGRPLDLLLPPRFIEAHRHHVGNFAAAPEISRHMEARLKISGRRKDGAEFPAEASISKLAEAGHTFFIAILRDITERVQREHILATMAEVGGLVTAGGDLQSTLDLLAQKAAEASGFEGAYIALYDAEKQEMTYPAIFTTRPMRVLEQLRGAATPLAEAPLLQQLLRTRQHILFEDFPNDPRARPDDRELARQDGVRMGVAWPLLYRGELIGRLDFVSVRPRRLSPEDLGLLSTLADQTATAVRNAQLFAESHRRLREVSLLLDVSAAGSASLRMDEMLPIILDHLLTGLVVDGATALTVDSSADLVRVRAARGEYEAVAGLTHRLEEMPAACALRSSSGVCFGQNDCPFFPDAGRPLKVACVSFKIGKQTRGGLGVGARRSDAFGEEQLRLLRGAADIAANALRRAALFEEVRLYKDAINSTAEGVAITDLQSHILDVNPAFERITGYSHAEALGQKISVVKSQHSTPEFYRAMWAQILSQGYWSGEIVNRRKNGEEWDAFLTISTVKDERGQPVAYVGINRDITEHKQRERELEAIATVSAALRTAATRAEMLPVILDQLRNLLKADGAAVGMRDPATGETVIELAISSAASYSGARIPPGQSVTGHVIATGQIYSNDDARTDPRLFRSELLGDMRAVICVPLIAQEQTIGAISLARDEKKSVLPPGFSASEVRLLTAVANIAANAIHRATLHEQVERDAVELSLAYDTTLEGWACALELRDKETEGHTRRVTEMAERLALAMGIGKAELVNIRRGALLHDIGKMGVPDSILLKPGPLTDDEWRVMRLHPQFAFDMLSSIVYLRPALDIPYCHHEKWDGSGYPRGLKGEQIPLAARLFAVVDVWDALRSDRPYREAWPEAKAREYIREQAGKHFDPEVVEVFLAISHEQ